jgi:hypothetical protein
MHELENLGNARSGDSLQTTTAILFLNSNGRRLATTTSGRIFGLARLPEG